MIVLRNVIRQNIEMTKYLAFLILFLIGLNPVLAQDPGFSQYFANELYINPAFSGYSDMAKGSVNYRNQWPGLQSTFITYCASYSQPVEFLHGGVGLVVMNDVQGNGAISRSSVDLQYSYKLRMTRNLYINAGFQTSYFQKRFRGTDLVFPDMIDPVSGISFPTQETISDYRRGFMDFSVGFMGSFRGSYFGIAVHHLTKPNESYSGNNGSVLPRKYTIHLGTDISTRNWGLGRNEFTLMPGILFQNQQQFQQLSYGLNLSMQSLILGLWMRQDLHFNYDSFIFTVGFKQMNYKFIYSYDLSITGAKLKIPTSGAHELTFIFEFDKKLLNRRKGAVKCTIKPQK